MLLVTTYLIATALATVAGLAAFLLAPEARRQRVAVLPAIVAVVLSAALAGLASWLA